MREFTRLPDSLVHCLHATPCAGRGSLQRHPELPHQPLDHWCHHPAGIPPARAQAAMDLATSCRSMVVVGSSLAVWSAFRLAKAAVENGAKLAVITAGPTRADELAAIKLEARAGEVLARLAAHPSLQVPPVY